MRKPPEATATTLETGTGGEARNDPTVAPQPLPSDSSSLPTSSSCACPEAPRLQPLHGVAAIRVRHTAMISHAFAWLERTAHRGDCSRFTASGVIGERHRAMLSHTATVK